MKMLRTLDEAAHFLKKWNDAPSYVIVHKNGFIHSYHPDTFQPIIIDTETYECVLLELVKEANGDSKRNNQ